MNEKEKSLIIAEAENVEAIRDFFTEWWSVEQLYETAAKASMTIMYLMNRKEICEDERKDLQELMTQHLMMIEHIKPFAKQGKEDEV